MQGQPCILLREEGKRMEYISDRLEQILIALGEASQPLTSAQLAEKVKVSARTVKKTSAS